MCLTAGGGCYLKLRWFDLRMEQETRNSVWLRWNMDVCELGHLHKKEEISI